MLKNPLLVLIYKDWFRVNNTLMFNRSKKMTTKQFKKIDLKSNFKVNLFWKDIYVVNNFTSIKNKIIILEK